MPDSGMARCLSHPVELSWALLSLFGVEEQLDQDQMSRNSEDGKQKPSPGQGLLFLPHAPLQQVRETQRLSCLSPEACLPSPQSLQDKG